MELSQVSKSRKRGTGPQSLTQRVAHANRGKSLDELVDQLTANSEMFHKPGTPRLPKPLAVAEKTPPPQPPAAVPKRFPTKRTLAALTAAGGGGAYLYRRKRLERSAS